MRNKVLAGEGLSIASFAFFSEVLSVYIYKAYNFQKDIWHSFSYHIPITVF